VTAAAVPRAASDAVDVPPEFAQALRELGLAGAAEPLLGAPLAGGVSSDIWRIDTARGSVCAKRALARLRVAAEWRAPVDRNRYEARWLEVAQAAKAGAAPRLLGQHPALGIVVMTWLAPAEHRLWKELLRRGDADPAVARQVGATLAAIHAYSAARPALAAQFDSDAIFFAIRLEPYLLAAARRHADLAPALEQLVETTRSTKRALVHGDVSPKNILIGPEGPVLVDAECAWWGDPAFDVAFCLNHLLLKCVWAPAASASFLASFAALATAYLDAVRWEPRDAVERRAAALLPGLLLARVDGKSPVEYIDDDADRELVRRVAAALLRRPAARLAMVAETWREAMATR
jgi:aminoglycoside phosphotransferase (APT) family kinase protein